MKLWEKNYILTMIIILLVIYGSMFFVLQYSFSFNFKKAYEQGCQTEKSILYSVKGLYNEDEEHTKLKLYCESLEKQAVFFAVYRGEEVVVDSLPVSTISLISEKDQLVKGRDGRYLVISDSFLYEGTVRIFVYHVEEMEELYGNHQKQMYLFLGISAFLSFLIAGILYFAMKKIYYPMNNIAHELRTPLTSIQGYAQYILFGKVSAEDIQYACTQINEKAGYMNEIVERLLVMEHIKNGKILFKKVDLSKLFQALQFQYPSIIIESKMKYVMGDETLLLCLLTNLLSNTSRAGENIVLTASGNEICISNQDDFIEKDVLKCLNHNRSIPGDKLHGNGLGVCLCHDIAKLHHAKIHYDSQEREGVKITITFQESWDNGGIL